MRIVRLGGEYVRIALSDGSLAVFTNVAEGQLLDSGSVIGALQAAIEGVSFKRKPISTSTAWQLSRVDGEKVESKSEWELVSRLSVDIETTEKVVKAMGLTTRPFFGRVSAGFYVDLPKSWIEGDGREFKKFTQTLAELNEAVVL